MAAVMSVSTASYAASSAAPPSFFYAQGSVHITDEERVVWQELCETIQNFPEPGYGETARDIVDGLLAKAPVLDALKASIPLLDSIFSGKTYELHSLALVVNSRTGETDADVAR